MFQHHLKQDLGIYPRTFLPRLNRRKKIPSVQGEYTSRKSMMQQSIKLASDLFLLNWPNALGRVLSEDDVSRASKGNIRKNDYGCKSKNVARLSQSFVRIFQPSRNFFIAGFLAASAA